jgi:hypothetical protein
MSEQKLSNLYEKYPNMDEDLAVDIDNMVNDIVGEQARQHITVIKQLKKEFKDLDDKFNKVCDDLELQEKVRQSERIYRQ